MTQIKRRDDWMDRLVVAVKDANALPFRYGVHDCCLWAAHCVDRMCDTNIARSIIERFNYSDEQSANAIIAAAGGLKELVSEFLGDPIPSAFAAPGDIVIARNGDQALVAVVIGHNIIAPTSDGLTVLPFANGVLCWKV